MNRPTTVGALVERISAERGPFFVARLGLRLQFLLDKEAASERREHIDAIVNACRELGYDVAPWLLGARAATDGSAPPRSSQ